MNYIVYDVICMNGNIVISSFSNYLDALIDCNKYNSCMRNGLFVVKERRQ